VWVTVGKVGIQIQIYTWSKGIAWIGGDLKARIWKQVTAWGVEALWNINEWFVNWQLLMQLWQKILVIFTSIVIATCERGFSK
jgi:hypothetical protein